MISLNPDSFFSGNDNPGIFDLSVCKLAGTLGALGACLHPGFETGAILEAGDSVGFPGFSACLGGLLRARAHLVLSGQHAFDSQRTNKKINLLWFSGFSSSSLFHHLSGKNSSYLRGIVGSSLYRLILLVLCGLGFDIVNCRLLNGGGGCFNVLGDSLFVPSSTVFLLSSS